MKKLSVFMAALATVTMAVNSGYADMSVYAKTDKSVTESAEKENAKSTAFKGEREVKTNFKITKAMLVSDDRVYYTGSNKERNFTLFSTDYEGNIKNSLEIKSDLKDENGAFATYSDKMKQIGDYLYLFYEAAPYVELNLPETGEWVSVPASAIPSSQSFKCVKLDKELNIIEEFELRKYAKKDQYIDINSTKIAYIKSGKEIYTVNHDGSGKKLLYTIGDKGIDTYHINSISINEDYISFAAQASRGTYKTLKGSDGTTIYEGDPDYTYCGIIDLKTGEVTLEKKDDTFFTKAYDSIVTWDYSIADPWNGKSGRIYTYDGKSFETVKTKSGYESYFHTADNDGSIIGIDLKEHTIHVYKNGKLVKEIKADNNNNEHFGFVDFTANNGVAAVTYTDTKSGTTCKVKLIAY